MSQAEKLEGKGRRLTAAVTDTSIPIEQPPAVRTKPFKLSVELAPALYNDFALWAVKGGAEIKKRIPLTRVLRSLLRLMLADDNLGQAVLRDLRDH
jgi:hypothetical protein